MDGFRPLYTPAALALAIPSSWRSRRRFVSNSANTPSISRKHWPAMLMSNRLVCAPWRDWKECYGAGMVLPIDQHDALRMLAGSPGGCPESILLAHGFGIGTVHEL